MQKNLNRTFFSIIIIIYFFLSSRICLANTIPSCEHTNTSFKCVKYISNFDGDTITFDIPNVHPFFGYHAHVRIYGVDAPEITSDNKCEKKVAELAKNRIATVLLAAKKIDLLNVATEKYGRILAEVLVDDSVNLGPLLLKENLAYEYYGATKKKINWCLYKNSH